MLPGRTRDAVQGRALRIGVQRRPRWTKRDDERLADSWEQGHHLGRIAHRLGRLPRSVRDRAMTLGLGTTAPHGYETLTAAFKRAGFNTTVQLRRVLEWAGVRIYVSRSYHPVRHWRRHFVDPMDVDDAVAAWVRAETVAHAARRHGVMRRTLQRWIERAGAHEPRGRNSHWRLDPAAVDQVVNTNRSRRCKSR